METTIAYIVVGLIVAFAVIPIVIGLLGAFFGIIGGVMTMVLPDNGPAPYIEQTSNMVYRTQRHRR